MRSPEIVILRTLLEKENGFVSGARIAETLGISRVAIWQHMERLRKQGFEFEAVRALGYRITKYPTEPHPELINAYLDSRALSFELNCLTEIDSTNDEAARQLAASCHTPYIVIARHQSKGRGRFGRLWHSEANGNLYISFAFRPSVAPVRMQTFTLWMGANICELVANFTRTSPGIKWPNDILFGERKAGGMLTEARIDADEIRDLVLGLGLNLNSAPAHWPDHLVRQATSLSEQTKTQLDPNKFTAALIGRVLDAYEQFVKDAPCSEALQTLWKKYDLLYGKTITLLHGTNHITGLAHGIDNEGSLILKTESGSTRRFRAGEVTLGKKPEKLKA